MQAHILNGSRMCIEAVLLSSQSMRPAARFRFSLDLHHRDYKAYLQAIADIAVSRDPCSTLCLCVKMCVQLCVNVCCRIATVLRKKSLPDARRKYRFSHS